MNCALSNWIIKDTLFPAYKLTYFFNEGSREFYFYIFFRLGSRQKSHLNAMYRKRDQTLHFLRVQIFISAKKKRDAIEINSSSFLINWWISESANKIEGFLIAWDYSFTVRAEKHSIFMTFLRSCGTEVLDSWGGVWKIEKIQKKIV